MATSGKSTIPSAVRVAGVQTCSVGSASHCNGEIWIQAARATPYCGPMEKSGPGS
jgi:hypothetical protein